MNENLQLDPNLVLKLIADGTMTPDQVNYMLNSMARYQERVEEASNGQVDSTMSVQGDSNIPPTIK